MNIDLIAGARPNFMKIAPIVHAIQKEKKIGKDINYRLVHTGQHYDKNMSEQFFTQLNIPEPHFNLGAGGGTQAQQTAKIMTAYEDLLLQEGTDLCLVVGDVTSTMACSIVAKKLNIKVAHVEAGIRSADLKMPEEINRIVTDSITDLFFTTTELAGENLKTIGVYDDAIHFVGNTMIDTLLSNRAKFKKPDFWEDLNLRIGKYIVMTLHRPSNVDEAHKLETVICNILEQSNGLPLVFPVHPRTRKVLKSLEFDCTNLHFVAPQGYLEFNYLVENALAVITDSGGITEETTVMGVPCMTLRDSTERPETVTIGTNELLGTDGQGIPSAMERLFVKQWKKGEVPKLWDGKTANRIIAKILELQSQGYFVK